MNTWALIAERIRGGTNPVEVAGYGHESTHKGYLAWLLDSHHWPGARVALERLLEAAEWPPGEQQRAACFLLALPPSFRCWTEKSVGGGKVDLLLAPGEQGARPRLAIELKVDSPPGRGQFQKMARGLGKDADADVGVVLLLGTSAIRDDDLDRGGYDRFGKLTLGAILKAWEGLALPPPGQAWLEALAQEQQRLEAAYGVPQPLSMDWRDVGYRSQRHLTYARLHAVHEALKTTAIPGPWHLYDGGFNTVLCLEADSGRSWIPVAQGVAAFWEWNDARLVLKVQAKEEAPQAAARAWLKAFQQRAEKVTCRVERGTVPKTARSGSTWISVLSWAPRFDNPRAAADDAIAVIDSFEPLVREEG